MSQRGLSRDANWQKHSEQAATAVDEAHPRQAPAAGPPQEAGETHLASFVVRIWALAGASVCRGQIVHVQSGMRGSFSDPAAMLAFIAEHGGQCSVIVLNTTLPSEIGGGRGEANGGAR